LHRSIGTSILVSFYARAFCHAKKVERCGRTKQNTGTLETSTCRDSSQVSPYQLPRGSMIQLMTTGAAGVQPHHRMCPFINGKPQPASLPGHKTLWGSRCAAKTKFCVMGRVNQIKSWGLKNHSNLWRKIERKKKDQHQLKRRDQLKCRKEVKTYEPTSTSRLTV
jgi:hypothetical protein